MMTLRHDARRTCLSVPLSFARVLLLVLLLLAAASRTRSQSIDTTEVRYSSLVTTEFASSDSDSDSFTSGTYDPTVRWSDFTSGMPNASPFTTTYLTGECQLISKWSGPRCAAGYECVSPTLRSQTSSLSLAQQQCVFCSATAYCTDDQLATCGQLQKNITMLTLVEVLNSTQGVGECEVCQEGQYCPSSANNPFSLDITNRCSSGYYCPKPDTETICPVGFYCLEGTRFPRVCPNKGAYCGQGSTSMSDQCPSGSYCPDPQTLITCPSGYFCKEGSIEPTKCQLLASCPAGSASALLVWQGVILVVAAFIGIGIIYYSIVISQTRRQTRELEEVARRTEGREVMELIKSLRTFQSIENKRTASTSRILQVDGAGHAREELTILRSTKDDPAATPVTTTSVVKVHQDDIVIEKNDQVSSNPPQQSANADQSQPVGATDGVHKPLHKRASSLEHVPGRGTIFPATLIEEATAAIGITDFDTGRGGVTIGTIDFKSMGGADVADDSDSDSEGDPDDALQGFDPIPCPISITFDELGLKLPNGKQVLSGITGEFAHSTLTAIMGPSGAGKTTFLNVLCGKSHYGIRTGKIRLNDVSTSIEAVRSLVGFVPQEDVMHTDLTCYENLYYSAMLRLPRAMPHDQKVRIVQDVIRLLGLEAVQHSIVGTVEKRGISGGQRKKVNIGVELVAWPTLLFLDEPTSGLDSTASFDVISALRDLTGLGVSICTVLHQPRFTVVELFHEMLLLGRGGRSVFHGSSEQAVAYFTDIGFALPSHENPADFFLDVISGDVRREYDPDFQPNDLFAFWEDTGGWVRAGDAQPPMDEDDSDDAPPQDTKTPSTLMVPPAANESVAARRAALPAINVHTPSSYHLSVGNLQPPPPLLQRQSSLSRSAMQPFTPQSALSGSTSVTTRPPPPLLRSNTVAMGMFDRRRTGDEDPSPMPSQQNPFLYPSTIAAAAAVASAAPRHPSVHNRSKKHFQAINALRAGVTSAADMPLPKHRELLARVGIDGVERLVEEYTMKKQRALRSATSMPQPRAGASHTPPQLPTSAPASVRNPGLSSSASAPPPLVRASTMRAVGFLFERQQTRANLASARSGLLPSEDDDEEEVSQQRPSERATSSTINRYRSSPAPLASSGRISRQNSSQLGGIDERGEEPTSARHPGLDGAAPVAQDDASSPHSLQMPQRPSLPRTQSAPHRARPPSTPPQRVRFQGCGDDDADGAGLDIAVVKLHFNPVPPAVELTRIDATSAASAVQNSDLPADGVLDHASAPVPPPFHPVLTTIPSEGELPSDGSSSGSRSTTDNKGPTTETDDTAVATDNKGPAAAAGDTAATPAIRRIPSETDAPHLHSRKASHDIDAAVLALRKRRPTITTDSPSSISRSLAAGSRFTKDSKVTMPQSQSGVLPPPRDVPYLHVQFAYLLQRQSRKLMRGMSEVVFDMCLTTVVGFAIGLVFGGAWSLDAYATISVLAVMSLGVISCVSALKMFGNDRVVFWRESSAGISVTAYWLAVTLLHLPLTVTFSFLFAAPYWSIILPEANFTSVWWVLLGVHFACSGAGMLFSVIMRPIPALLCGVMIPLCIGGFLNGVSPALADAGGFMTGLCDISYSRYGVEALVIQELTRQPSYSIGIVSYYFSSYGFTLDYFSFCVGMLFTIGCVLRVLTLAGLHLLNRDKRA